MKLGLGLDLASANKQMKATLENAQRAIFGGIEAATLEAKAELREKTRGAFRSNKLPTTWQSALYGKSSFNPAGLIYSKAPEIMRAFSQGVPVRSSKGFYLAIPTKNCPKKFNGRRVTPSNWPKEVYGPLEFVYRRNGRPLLVASQAPSKGMMDATRGVLGSKIKGGRRKINIRKNPWDAVMFILVPQVQLDKRLDPQATINAAGAAIPAKITARLKGGKA